MAANAPSPPSGLASWGQGNTGQHVHEICMIPLLPDRHGMALGLAGPHHTQPAPRAQHGTRLWAGMQKPQGAASHIRHGRSLPNRDLGIAVPYWSKRPAQGFVQLGSNFGVLFLSCCNNYLHAAWLAAQKRTCSSACHVLPQSRSPSTLFPSASFGHPREILLAFACLPPVGLKTWCSLIF